MGINKLFLGSKYDAFPTHSLIQVMFRRTYLFKRSQYLSLIVKSVSVCVYVGLFT